MSVNTHIFVVGALLFGAATWSGLHQADHLTISIDTPQSSIQLSVLGQYQSGIYNESAAEIVTYEPNSRRAFVVNAASGEIDVLDLSNAAAPIRLSTIDVSDLGAVANSVAVNNGIVAIAIEAAVRTDNGFVAFYDADGIRLSVVEVGALPDALTFSPNGRFVIVANEGEPNDDYSIDPEGSVSIIDLADGVIELHQSSVRTVHFREFNGREDELRAQGVRIFGPGSTAAQDFEPEWVEVNSDSTTAYVSLQENNAIGVIDIATATVKHIYPLGFKDWSATGQWSGNGFDASDKDGGINIRHWPVFGIYQPDSIRLYETDGETYVLTANEGDTRDYSAWSEEIRVSEMRLDPTAFPDAKQLHVDANLGRLIVTTTLGISNGRDPSDMKTNVKTDCVYNELYTFGGRSMSIWRVTETGLELVFDTGSQLEETITEMYPDYFNSDHVYRDIQLDRRSPAKGPEPEGLAVGDVNGRTYAFLGLERIGGVMVYDITKPDKTTFIQYINNRDFTIAEDSRSDPTRTDLGAEGLHFISAAESPDAERRPLLLVGNEVSGTTTIFVINSDPDSN